MKQPYEASLLVTANCRRASLYCCHSDLVSAVRECPAVDDVNYQGNCQQITFVAYKKTCNRNSYRLPGPFFLSRNHTGKSWPGSSVGKANGYGLDGPGIESRWGQIFRTCPDRPWAPPSLLYNGYRVFLGCTERPRRDADPSPPSSAVVKKE